MMFGQTVTIYNRHGNDNPARWGRRVLHGVYWRSGVSTSLGVTGVTGGQLECLLILPHREGYVTPAAYAAAESHDDIWTLQPGDAIIPGEGPDGEITGAIQKAVPGCKLIASITDHWYGSTMDHWEVTCK